MTGNEVTGKEMTGGERTDKMGPEMTTRSNKPWNCTAAAAALRGQRQDDREGDDRQGDDRREDDRHGYYNQATPTLATTAMTNLENKLLTLLSKSYPRLSKVIQIISKVMDLVSVCEEMTGTDDSCLTATLAISTKSLASGPGS